MLPSEIRVPLILSALATLETRLSLCKSTRDPALSQLVACKTQQKRNKIAGSQSGYANGGLRESCKYDIVSTALGAMRILHSAHSADLVSDTVSIYTQPPEE
jgi:hypothetical protein